MLDALRSNGVGQTTIRDCYDRLSQALKLAAQLGMIQRNPCYHIERPALPHNERKTWTLTQLSMFLENAKGSAYGPIWLLIAATGIRRGEAMGLRWSDLDFERGIMHIRQAVTMVHGSPVIGPTKSRSGRRDIPLSESMLAELRAHRASQQGYLSENRCNLVFPSAAGTPINARNLDRQYHGIIKRAGVPHITIHGLRHTFATLAIAEGEDVRTISDILGHSKTSVTTDIYGHAVPHRRVELANHMSDLILQGTRATRQEQSGIWDQNVAWPLDPAIQSAIEDGTVADSFISRFVQVQGWQLQEDADAFVSNLRQLVSVTEDMLTAAKIIIASEAAEALWSGRGPN